MLSPNLEALNKAWSWTLAARTVASREAATHLLASEGFGMVEWVESDPGHLPTHFGISGVNDFFHRLPIPEWLSNCFRLSAFLLLSWV